MRGDVVIDVQYDYLKSKEIDFYEFENSEVKEEDFEFEINGGFNFDYRLPLFVKDGDEFLFNFKG